MKHALFFTASLSLFVLALGCNRTPATSKAQKEPSGGDQSSLVDEAAKAKAIAAKNALFERLSGRLSTVLKADGPAAAIEVCSREASDIARTVGTEQGVQIGRTSLKLRNPANAPPDWVKPLMDPSSVDPQFISLPNGHTGALLPIKLQTKCVTCHGATDLIPQGVREQLSKLYPRDQATGFNEGDLRGWFWVNVPPQTDSQDRDRSSGRFSENQEPAATEGQ